MIYKYNFSAIQDCTYISMHMNYVINSPALKSKFKLNYLKKDLVDLICNDIKQSNDSIYILDFSGISSLDTVGVLSSLDELYRTSELTILLINLEQSIFLQTRDTDCCGSVIPIGEEILTNSKGKDFYYMLIKDGAVALAVE